MKRLLPSLLLLPWLNVNAQQLMRLSEQQALSLALQQHWDYRQRAIALRGAEADAVQAAAAPNPALTFSTANINPHTGIGAGPLADKAVDSILRVDQLIERGGKRELRSDAAQQRVVAAAADRADTRRTLERDVRQAYADLLASQERQRVLAEVAALQEQSLAVARKRREAGDLAEVEVARLQLEVQRAQNDLNAAALQHRTASYALAQQIGLALPLPELQASDSWDNALPFMHEAAGAPCEERADVQASRARLTAADRGLALAQAARTRDISVGLQAEHFPVSPAHPQGTGNSFGFSVQIPLFVRYNNEGEIRSALAAQDAATLALDKARTQACSEAMQSSQQLMTSQQRAAVFQGQLLAAARHVAETAEFAFEHGALSVTDVLDARRSYRMTQLDGIDARADYLKALAAWRATHTFDLP
ncbi:TolC family protein [Massilia eburnea]|nr:TolC family protein [Massilia eburnea]